MTETKRAWNLHLIKAAIGMAGLTQTKIAKMAGLEAWQVRHGLRGNNRQGAEAIADAIGVPFRELFPDSYLRGEVEPIRKPADSTSAKRHRRADDVRGAA
jgi:Ner family transcriptional regulator